jgi:hypothetical protein
MWHHTWWWRTHVTSNLMVTNTCEFTPHRDEHISTIRCEVTCIRHHQVWSHMYSSPSSVKSHVFVTIRYEVTCCDGDKHMWLHTWWLRTHVTSYLMVTNICDLILDGDEYMWPHTWWWRTHVTSHLIMMKAPYIGPEIVTTTFKNN